MSRLRRAALLVAGPALLAAPLAAPLVAQPTDKPRLDAARVAGETVLGAYAGIGGYFIGRRLGHELALSLGAESPATIRRSEFVGSAIGGIGATALVVHGIGSLGDQAGDLDATVLGTTAGFVVAVGVARLILGPDLRPESGASTALRWTVANVLAFMPAIGGTIGFNSTRRSQ